MNPRTDLTSIDTETARAFIHLFIEHGDLFQFARDYDVSDDEEVRAFVIEEDHKSTDDGKSTLCVTGINNSDTVNEIARILEDMGLTIIEEEQNENYHESIGDYISDTIVAFAPPNIDAEWNIPHLRVYGSIYPEIEEACNVAFGNKYTYHNVRNHYVIVGEGLSESDITKLSDTIGSMNIFFDDDKQHAKSSVNTAELV